MVIRQLRLNNYISTGQITNHTGTPLVADYNNIVAGRTRSTRQTFISRRRMPFGTPRSICRIPMVCGM